MAKTKNKLAPLHVVQPEPKKLYLDIGCGKTKPEQLIASWPADYGQTQVDEWDSIDAIDFGQKHVLDVRKGLSYPDDSVSGIHSSHFVEHLTGAERVPFFNELYRVMKVGAVAKIITPHWSNACAYGDPTHQFPPMSEWFAYYLEKSWRDNNGPHTGYTCDFDYNIIGTADGRLAGRNQEFMQNSMMTQINATRDLVIILTKKR